MFIHGRVSRGQLWPAFSVLVLGAIVSLFAARAAAQTLTAVSVCGHPGDSIWFSVALNPRGKSIAAIQNDISFDSTNTPISTCQIADGVNKSLSWTYLPNGCSGTGCTGMRGIVLSASDTNALIQGVVYQCRIDIPTNATPGNYALTVSNPAASDPLANPQPLTGASGSVLVTTGTCSC
jgi:hypothetical protein